MKQADNLVVIEGILSEVNIKEGESKKDGKPYVMGEVKVKTKEEINGVEIDLEIPVSLFATKLTKKGTSNPAYEAIQKLSQMTSIAACGDEAHADLIRFKTADIGSNEFYGPTGNLISYPRVRASFSEKVRKEDYTPKATFNQVIVVGGIKDEIDKNGDTTGRIIVTGIVPQYGDKVDVINYIVAAKPAISHIQTYWNKGDTVRIAGKVNFSFTTITKEIEMGFGESQLDVSTTSVKELLITSGSQGPLDEDESYTEEEIRVALTERVTRLDAMKAVSESKKKAAASAPSLGF